MSTGNPLAYLHGELIERAAGLPELRRQVGRLRDDPDLLRTSLALLIEDDAALSEVAGRSYGHPNGFEKIVLHIGGGYGIRLHVWHRRNGRWISDANPHGHRWEFASWIVTGSLLEITYAESADGGPHLRCEYGRDPNGAPMLIPNGAATLREVDRVDHLAGRVYQRSRTIVHTVTPTGRDLVASLVLQGPRSLTPTPVYLQWGDEPEHKEYELRPAGLRALLADVLDTV